MNKSCLREEIIALEMVLGQKCYWSVLINTAHLCVYIKGIQMNIKLPLPVILTNSSWNNQRKNREHDKKEIERCKAIWSGLTEVIQEKLNRINAGESSAEDEFNAGILFEDGSYGLKYKESWPL